MRAAFRAAALAAALSISPGSAVLAADATLTARGGGLAVSGRLVAYDGALYRIQTEWGLLTVDAAAVDCAGPGCPDLTRFAPDLRIALEPWLAERLLAPLAEGFAAAEGLELIRSADDMTWELSRDGRPELRLQLLPLAGPAAAVLAAGDADAALAHPDPDRAAGHLVARLPLVLASAADAPAGALALDALRDHRRRGDTAGNGWARVTGGNSSEPLVWHGMAAGGMLDRAADAALGPLQGSITRRAGTPAEMAAALARDPWGLGLLPTPLPPTLRPRTVTESCGLLTDLSDFAAAAGEHTLTAEVEWREARRHLPAAARDFAAYLTSPAAQRLLHAAGNPAPSPLRRQGLAAQGPRLANALLAGNPEVALSDLQSALIGLRGAERLALSFRRTARGDTLDTAGQTALASLSNHLASGALRGHEVLLLGFTDARGPAADNRALAQARADAVLEALLAATPDLPPETRLRAEGLGEIMPLTCDDSAEGRAMNRRVEVWVRPF